MSRINTNISALNTQRIMKGTNQQFAQTVGRLSSGFRINRAADDAAGLGIANKLRADIRSMSQASRNAEQGTSMLQVAEGAAQTVQSIVDRMKELAVQSASDNVADSERSLIQAEFTELQDEISRIVDTTKFQGNTLLNGTLGNSADLTDVATTVDTAVGFGSAAVSGAGADTYTFSQTAGAVTLTNSAGDLTQVVTASSGGAQTLKFDALGITVETSASFAIGAGSENLTGDLVVAGGNTSFMVSVSGQEGTGGAAGNDDIGLSSMDLTLATLGLDADNLGTKAGAQAAIGNIDSAISTISGVFGDIGAAQNRLDYALANVRTATENFQAAESTIRDADIAAEATELSRLQILQQAATSVLAQANQAPQGVLSLLR